MGLKKDLEDLFLDTDDVSQQPINGDALIQLVKKIPIEKVTNCIDAVNAVHEVISKAKNNTKLEELANQLIQASDLLNTLRLAIKMIMGDNPAKIDNAPKATGDEDPFDLPLVTPKSGKITPTKAK